MDTSNSSASRAARFTHQECVEAIREAERRQGRGFTPREREAFAVAFYSEEYRQEIRRLVSWEIGR